MSLWAIIRDWFVTNIFGGYTSSGSAVNMPLGAFRNISDNSLLRPGSAEAYAPVTFFNGSGAELRISVGDWLSTTATLIVMISVCVALWFLVRYFFRMFAGLISGR